MNEKEILISVKLDENKIASKLKEIKTAINNLEKDNQKLQVAMEKLGDSTGNFSRAIETNNNKIKSLQGEYTKLESKLSENNKATQNLANKTTDLSKAEDKLSSSVKESNTSLNANEKELNKVEESLNKNVSSTNSLASSQEKLGSTFSDNASRIQQLDGQLNESTKKLEEFRNNVNQLESKTINVDVNVNTTTSGSTVSSSDVSNSMQNMDTDVNKLEIGLTRAQSAVNVLRQAFVNLGMEGAAAIAGIGSQVATLAVAIAKKDYVEAIASAINLVAQLRVELEKLEGIKFTGDFAPLNEGFREAEQGFQSIEEKAARVGPTIGRIGKQVGWFLGGLGKGFKNTLSGMFKEHKKFRKAWREGWDEAWSDVATKMNTQYNKIEVKKQVEAFTKESLEARSKIQQRDDEIRQKQLELEKASGEEKIRIENEIQNLKLKNIEEEWRIQEEKLRIYENALKTQQEKVKVSGGISGEYTFTSDSIDTSKLTEAEYEQLIKLRDAASQARAEYQSLDEQVNKLNSTFEKQIEILHDQEKLTANRRKYESDEIDRAQKITELRRRLGDNEKQITNIQRQSLQERAKLLEEEIALEEKKISVVGEASDTQTERLHQLQMELKKTNYAIQNLSSGFSAAEIEAGGFGSILGNITTQVGESSQALSLLGFTGASSIKRIITGIKALSKVMTSWVGIVIAAAIIAIKGITKAFQENQTLMNSLTNLYAAFEPIIERLNVVFELFAHIIAKVCDGLAYLVRLTAGTQEQFVKEQAEAKKLKDATNELNEAKRQYAIDEENRQQKIAELEKIVNDTELKSIEERIAAQEEINKIKEESLRDAQINANRELAIFKAENQKTLDELEKIKRWNGEWTEEQEENYNRLRDELKKLELQALQAANAMTNAYQAAQDGIINIITTMSAEEIKAKLDVLQADLDAHNARMQMKQDETEADRDEIKRLMDDVMHKNQLEEAVIFLRQHGVEVLKEEEKQWDKIYEKLLNMNKLGPLTIGIDPVGNELQEQYNVYKKAYDRVMARNKTTHTTPKSSGKSDEEKQREKEAEELAKYWAKVLDDSEKELTKFLEEIRSADKEFRELSMNPIEIFDLNLEETLSALDKRRQEIQAKIEEIRNKPTNTDEEKKQQEESLAHYTQMYAEFETLRTAITQKAAKERAKLEEEQTKESLEHRLTEIERYYKRQKEEMMANPLDISGGETFTFFKNSEIDEAKMNLAQAKDEVNALKEALLELEPGTEAYEEMADRIVDANIKVIEKNKELIDSVANTATTYMSAMDEITGSISSLMAAKKKEVQNSKKSEAEKEALIHEYEEKEKQMTVAQIAFSTATAIAKGIADAMTLMYPANLAAMASTIAAIIAGIAQAKSAMAGYNDGGVIPGNSYTGDNLLIRANSDEMVLTKKQQKKLFDMANGRGGGGNQYYIMYKAFSNAISKMPAPILDYSEYTTFTNSVNSMNNLVKVK